MSILAAREILPRTFQHRLGESPTATRRWNLTVDDHVPAQQAVNAVGAILGVSHPDVPGIQVLDVSVEEVDRYHVEVQASYGVEDQENNPIVDTWSFATGGSEVPALTYYDGAGNATKKSLVNGAKDFFEGLTTLEAEVRATISWRRPSFPAALAAAVTNTVNSTAFGFGGVHTWFCAGISAQQQVEATDDGGVEIYWQGTSELIYRASGWNLLLPNIGFNFLENGAKIRAYVEFKNEDGSLERVPAVNPVPLENDGTRRDPALDPLILERRVFPEIDFNEYFSAPPS